MKIHPLYKDFYYEESDDTIRNIITGEVKNITFNKKTGYYSISIHSKKVYVHRFVWECYNGLINLSTKESNGLTIDHIDNDKSNNKIDNLKLLTKRENCRRNNKTGMPYGISKHKKRYNIQFCKNGVYYSPYFIGEKTVIHSLEKAKIVRDMLANALGITIKHEMHGISEFPEAYKVQFFIGNEHKDSREIGEKYWQYSLQDAIRVRDLLAKHLGINL